jgi:1-acyl-sn-glycerol-3-phosphate acyltransferase
VIVALRARNPGRSLGAILFYETLWCAFRALWAVLWRFEAVGAQRAPAAGPLLVIANHQSHLDPVSLGLALPHRHVTFLAKSGLFTLPVFAQAIRLLNAFPIKQGSTDTAAIRASIDLLARGRALMVFPEGSRTPTGAIHPFKRGAWLVLSRAKCPVLPMAIEGTYDILPRGAWLPRLFTRRIMVAVGEPIAPERLLAMKPDEGLEFLGATIEAMRQDLHARMLAKGQRPTTKARSREELDADGRAPTAAAERAHA